MANEGNFLSNHAALIAKDVIPSDHDPESLPDWAKTAIESLKPEEIDALEEIAKRTNSHIYIHHTSDGRHAMLVV